MPGKSLHEGFPDSDRRTYIDYNRSGVPLIEIVSEPDMRSAAQGGGVLRAAARHPGVARRQRRQHGRGQPALRRERVGASGGAGGVRDEGRGQESELVPLSAEGARVRNRSADRRPRGRRTRRAGDAAVGLRRGADAVDAQQGRGARLSLFSRTRSAAARRGRGAHRGGARDDARAARGATAALRRRLRAAGVRRGRADAVVRGSQTISSRPHPHRAVRKPPATGSWASCCGR